MGLMKKMSYSDVLLQAIEDGIPYSHASDLASTLCPEYRMVTRRKYEVAAREVVQEINTRR